MARLITDFELWQPGYANAVVTYYVGASDTLADLYYDEAETEPAPNPVTLASWEDDCCNSYGRFSQPIYIDAVSYSRSVNGLTAGGVHRPGISTLSQADASLATVRVPGSSYDRALGEAVGVVVHVDFYGQLVAAEAAANAALLTTCIGVAAGRGGGVVVVPAGTWDFTELSIPAKVMLAGAGKDVTTLRSTTADTVIELAGDDAGLLDITLDGIALNPDSIGIETRGYALRLDHAKVKRFDIGILAEASARALLREADIDNCDTGIQWFAKDEDAMPATGLRWFGGSLANTTTTGLHLKAFRETSGCLRTDISGVRFHDNFGDAVVCEGAQFTALESCDFNNNLRHIDVMDNDAVTPVIESNSFRVFNSTFATGEVRVTQRAQDILFRACRFTLHTWKIVNPINALLLEGCIEDATVAVDGDTTRIQRRRIFDEGGTTVITTSSGNTVIWQAYLEPGQVGMITAKVACVGASTTHSGAFIVTGRTVRPGASLLFSNRTVAFTNGQIVRGQTSGATGRIQNATNATSGTLTLRQVIGTFQDLEMLVADLGGSAQANGVVSLPSVTVANIAAEFIGRTTDSLSVTLTASASEVQVVVNGITNETVEWSADVELVLTT